RLLSRRARHRRAAAVVLGVAAAGCAGANERPAVTRIDSAGIEIVTSTSPAWDPGEEWRLAPAPRVRIGRVDGPPELQLYRVVDAARLTDGRIVVANAGTAELRVYAADGTYLSALGAEGEGPGEFRNLRSIDLGPGDTIYASDTENRRVSVFAPGGPTGWELARSFTLDAHAERRFPLYRGRFADGSLLVSARRVLADPPADGAVLRGTTTYLAYDTDGAPALVLGDFPNTPRYVRTTTRGGGVIEISFTDVPFEIGTRWAMGGDELFVAADASYEVRAIGPDGRVARILRRVVEPASVSPDLVEHLVEEADDPERREWLREAYAATTPERVPAIDSLRADRDGHLWARRYRMPGAVTADRWDVFARDGRWLGEVRTPRALEVLAVGHDFVLGRERDELDVERVVVYEIVGSGKDGRSRSTP
ncbi:MAG: 6-bladed beta-propeller, partial [Gemmatimonadota bacterium]